MDHHVEFYTTYYNAIAIYRELAPTKYVCTYIPQGYYFNTLFITKNYSTD